MTSDAFEEKPPQERIDEIEAERERRLDPENRPENAEVDNSDATLPTVEEFARLNEGEDQEGAAGSADPSRSSARTRPPTRRSRRSRPSASAASPPRTVPRTPRSTTQATT